MSVRYVVMVRGVDDSFSAYGTFRDLDRAEKFAGSFNDKVQKYEDSHPDEPSGLAWAYVMALREPRAKDAAVRAGAPWTAHSQERGDA